MSVLIGHASIDENGRAYGGVPGDQTTREVCTRYWYNRPWTVLLRPVSATTAEKMAAFCEAVCKNDMVGYNQYQRNSLRAAAQKAGWDPAKIGRCDTDCSAFMTVCAEAAGVDVSKCYTYGNAPVTQTMRSDFAKTGAFTVLTDSKYLTSDKYLKRGDILVYEPGHTVMVLTNGEAAQGGTASPTTAPAESTDSTVYFIGTTHYATANGTSGKPAKQGPAKITATAKAARHPYHLIHTDSTSNVYGWVDKGSFCRLHTVVSGDTLWGLSRKYGTTIPAIQQLNGLSTYLIRVGQVLRIPWV